MIKWAVILVLVAPNDLADIDNIVHIKSSVEVGSFVNVKIEKANEYELIGKLV